MYGRVIVQNWRKLAAASFSPMTLIICSIRGSLVEKIQSIVGSYRKSAFVETEIIISRVPMFELVIDIVHYYNVGQQVGQHRLNKCLLFSETFQVFLPVSETNGSLQVDNAYCDKTSRIASTERTRELLTVNLSPHHLLRLRIIQLSIWSISVIIVAAILPSLALIRPPQRLRTSNRPARRQRWSRNRGIIGIRHRCASRSSHRRLSIWGRRRALYHLPPISNHVIVLIVSIEAICAAILVLALPPRRREEALLTLSPTSHTGWIAGIVDTS